MCSSFEKVSFDGVSCESSDSDQEWNNVTKDCDSSSCDESGFEEYDDESRQTDFGKLDTSVSLSVFSSRFQSSCHHHKTTTKFDSILLGDVEENEQESQLIEFKKLRPPLDIVFPSLGLLKNFQCGFPKNLTGKEGGFTKCKTPSVAAGEEKEGPEKLSTADILRLAGKKFIQTSTTHKVDDELSSSMLGLSENEKLDVVLVQNLLALAEQIGQQNYEPAHKILSQCNDISLQTGNPVQRLVYYFSEALREKISRETEGRITSNSFDRKQLVQNEEEAAMILNPVCAALDEQMPQGQICIYTAMQAIIENVSQAKKVHIVDLQIRSGLQYTVLMQALAARSEYNPIELLKITAVGTKFKEIIDKTGEMLTSFAQSMNLPFSYSVVMVSDIIDLKLEHFEVEDDETVAIYASFVLRGIIGKPDRLESLMRVLSSMKPSIMVLTEVEANHTSPVFVKRFTESLFFFGAYFDGMEECMDRNGPHRELAETMYFGPGIKDIVAMENGERMFRHVTISVWRVFFARFWMVEEQLSQASLYQASLLLNNFSSWKYCSLVRNKKSLFIGWKGTPQISVSAWKFLQNR